MTEMGPELYAGEVAVTGVMRPQTEAAKRDLPDRKGVTTDLLEDASYILWRIFSASSVPVT